MAARVTPYKKQLAKKNDHEKIGGDEQTNLAKKIDSELKPEIVVESYSVETQYFCVSEDCFLKK